MLTEMLQPVTGEHARCLLLLSKLFFDPRIQVQAKCGDGSKAWNLDEIRTCVIDIGSCMLRECFIISKFWRECLIILKL